MADFDDGGPAFPWGEHGTVLGGATLRDLFAAHAVAGVCHMIGAGRHELGIVRPTGAAGIAHTAYEIADAMIAARSAA